MTPNFLANAESPLLGPLDAAAALLDTDSHLKLLIVLYTAAGLAAAAALARSRCRRDRGARRACSASGASSRPIWRRGSLALGTQLLPGLVCASRRAALGSQAALWLAAFLGAGALLGGSTSPSSGSTSSSRSSPRSGRRARARRLPIVRLGWLLAATAGLGRRSSCRCSPSSRATRRPRKIRPSARGAARSLLARGRIRVCGRRAPPTRTARAGGSTPSIWDPSRCCHPGRNRGGARRLGPAGARRGVACGSRSIRAAAARSVGAARKPPRLAHAARAVALPRLAIFAFERARSARARAALRTRAAPLAASSRSPPPARWRCSSASISSSKPSPGSVRR